MQETLLGSAVQGIRSRTVRPSDQRELILALGTVSVNRLVDVPVLLRRHTAPLQLILHSVGNESVQTVVRFCGGKVRRAVECWLQPVVEPAAIRSIRFPPPLLAESEVVINRALKCRLDLTCALGFEDHGVSEVEHLAEEKAVVFSVHDGGVVDFVGEHSWFGWKLGGYERTPREKRNVWNASTEPFDSSGRGCGL